jgi:hypothetical protein
MVNRKGVGGCGRGWKMDEKAILYFPNVVPPNPAGSEVVSSKSTSGVPKDSSSFYVPRSCPWSIK